MGAVRAGAVAAGARSHSAGSRGPSAGAARSGRSEAASRGGPGLGSQPAGFVLLLALVAVLVVIGLVMVLSASSVEALRQYGSSWYFFKRQVLWVTLGCLAMAVTTRLDYRRWRRVARPLLVGCCVLLLAVLVPGVGVHVGGSSRWLGVGAWRLQPSELSKLALAVYCADLLSRRRDRMHDLRVTLGPILVNLVTNSLKFVTPGVTPKVRLRAEERGEFIRVWVEDNGIGIAPEGRWRWARPAPSPSA